MAESTAKRHRWSGSLALVAVATVTSIGVLAAGTLWLIHRSRGQSAHAEATRTVIVEGEAIMDQLLRQPTVTAPTESDLAWDALSRLVQSMHTVQKSLQYVSVIKDGVTVFHVQTPRPAESEPLGSALPGGSGPVTNASRLSRRVIQLDDGTPLPVVVFSRSFATPDGDGVLEAALRVDAVGREERTAAGAIASMFRLSFVTILVSFGICAVFVVWVLRREMQREARRREEEHLAFSGVLANGIAHDFRNPMSSMRLDVQMLQRELAKPAPDSSRLDGLSTRIRGTLDRMDKVFQEFLYLSRPSKEEMEAIELGACVRDCLQLLAPRFESSGVRVEFRGGETAATVRAFSGPLRRAIINVLTNAEQHAGPSGSVRISVHADSARGFIDIRDSGPGIPRSERRRVFDMFVTSRPGGTGLGLFLAKSAVERSGGNISILDNEGGGACFRISLALADRAPQGEPT